MDEREKGFTQGLVYAVAQCLRNGQEYTAEFLWNEANFDMNDLNVCDDYDADELRKHFSQIVVEC